MDMATTMRNRPHWLTMPSAACTSALMRPATQILMKPMKKTRYIMSICGQVSFHMARGEMLRSGSGMGRSQKVCVRVARKRLLDGKCPRAGQAGETSRSGNPAADHTRMSLLFEGAARSSGRAGDPGGRAVARMPRGLSWRGTGRTFLLRQMDGAKVPYGRKRSKGERGAFPPGKSPSPLWRIGQMAQDYSRPS